MTFGGHIAYLRPRSVICGPSEARVANDTARVQISNMPDRSHFIIIIINKQGQIKARMQILIMQVENEFKDTLNHHDTTRAQISNMPSKSHFIPLLTN